MEDVRLVLTVGVHLVGLFVLITLVQVILTLVRKKVTVARKPLKYLKLGTFILLAALYINYVAREYWGSTGLPQGLTAVGTIMVFVLLAIYGVGEEVIDRAEHDQLLRVEATHVAETTE